MLTAGQMLDEEDGDEILEDDLEKESVGTDEVAALFIEEVFNRLKIVIKQRHRGYEAAIQN